MDEEREEREQGANGAEGVPLWRIQAGKHREIQIARTGGRKLFDEEAKETFLEWFGATCNLSMSAEQAGFNYKTVSKHYLKDPGFAARVDEAMRLGVMRLKAKSLEAKGEPKVGPEGELDAPGLDDLSREEAMRLVREHERTLTQGRKQGRTPRVASNAEVDEALAKRMAAYAARLKRAGDPPQDGEGDHAKHGGGGPEPHAAMDPLHHAAARRGSPPRPGEDL